MVDGIGHFAFQLLEKLELVACVVYLNNLNVPFLGL